MVERKGGGTYNLFTSGKIYSICTHIDHRYDERQA